jgi:hypothetical protein
MAAIRRLAASQVYTLVPCVCELPLKKKAADGKPDLCALPQMSDFHSLLL